MSAVFNYDNQNPHGRYISEPTQDMEETIRAHHLVLELWFKNTGLSDLTHATLTTFMSWFRQRKIKFPNNLIKLM
eukprot:8222450-Karenia_brevis.AAC.1